MIYEASALNPREDFSEVAFPCPTCTEKGILNEQCKMPLFRDLVKLPPEAILSLIFGADCPSNYVSELLPTLAEERHRHVNSTGRVCIRTSMSSITARRMRRASRITNGHTERIARAERHTVHSIQGYGYAPFAAQKGINYRPPREQDQPV